MLFKIQIFRDFDKNHFNGLFSIYEIYELRPKEIGIVDHIDHVPNLADRMDGSTERCPMGCGRSA